MRQSPLLAKILHIMDKSRIITNKLSCWPYGFIECIIYVMKTLNRVLHCCEVSFSTYITFAETYEGDIVHQK